SPLDRAEPPRLDRGRAGSASRVFYPKRLIRRSGEVNPLKVSRAVLKHPFHQVTFLTTAAEWRQLPAGGAPEVAFAGRSNAGKSSAINALAERTRLAFTSKTPGRTQHINLFRLRSGALLADLPGYGYAKVPEALRRPWQR